MDAAPRGCSRLARGRRALLGHLLACLLILCGGASWAAAPGDVTKDGSYDVRDLIALEGHLRGSLTLDAEQLEAGDVAPLALTGATGGDEVVDAADLTVLHRLVAGQDVDGDLLSTAFEVLHGLSPLAGDEDQNGIQDGLDDSDQDGLTNRREEALAQIPDDPDSDGDGVLDGRDAPAPALLKTVLADLKDAHAYVYSGIDPIQAGAEAASIDPARVAILRGLVEDANGAPIPGVTVAVANHPEYGSTRTLSDGQFDLVVNGGEIATLVYDSAAHLRLWRRVELPLLDYATAPDVTLQAVDAEGTGSVALSTGSTTASHWRGSTITDDRGTRRPTMIFQPGTTAQIAGSPPVPLPTVTVQATEGTRASAPDAIPSTPLDISGGHHAVWVGDFSVQEAPGAERVEFVNAAHGTKPVVFYYENFVDYEVGTVVGNANLDTSHLAWTETGNTAGRVVKIVGITGGGLASVDTDGNGTADDTDLTTEERAELASLYSVGQELFRFPIQHFSRICTHKGFIWPLDATVPDVPTPQPQAPDDCTPECGSLIDAESQVLREDVAIAGTPWRLHYTSERTPGYLAAYRVRVPVTGPTIPNSLARAQVKVEIAGQKTSYPVFERGVNLAPNLSQLVTWSGEDPYERRPQGRQPVRAVVEWTYPFRGDQNPDGTPKSGALNRGAGIRRREWTGHLGPWDNRAQGLGGWTLTAVHAYDARTRILYRGDGERVSAESLPDIIESPIANEPPTAVAAGPDGRIYFARGNVGLVNRIYRIESDGTLTTIAGNGTGDPGDGGPALNTRLYDPHGLAFGPDGSLYIVERTTKPRVRRIQAPVEPTATITTVAGTGVQGEGGDSEQPATEVDLASPEDVFVAPDGTLFISDWGNGRLRRVTPDGRISTVVGTGGGSCQATFPVLGTQASVPAISSSALAPDGSLFVASSGCNRIYRLASDGMLDVFAGNGSGVTATTDGVPATTTSLASPYGVSVTPSGGVLVSAWTQHRVRRIGPDGIISTIAGDGTAGGAGANGDGGPAARGLLSSPLDVTASASEILVADGSRVRRIRPPLPGFTIGNTLVPSSDGSEVYEFDATGRHLYTLDATRLERLPSGGWKPECVKLTMAYTDAGLDSVADAFGNITTAERNTTGVATALVGPFGDRTTLDVNGAGWLTRVVDPSGADHDFGYDPGTTSDGTGLLTSYTTPEEHTYAYSYDSEGLLTLDEDPAGGSKMLARTDAAPIETPGWKVAVETALGRESTYSVEEPGDGSQVRSAIDPAGLTTTTARSVAFVETTSEPNGAQVVVESSGDPRFGFTAAYASRHLLDPPLATPSFERTLARTATVNASGVLTGAIDTITLHPAASPRTSTVTWDHDQTESWLPGAAGRRRTVSFVATRVLDEMLDARGRLVGSKLGSLHPVKLTYDARGRVESVAQGPGTGDRTTSFAYHPITGRLDSITDPASRITTFDLYDAAGRVLSMTLPGNRTVGFSYDSNGNLTSLTPSGKPAHVFRYTAIDQEDEYEPPALAGIPDPRTLYDYDLDRNLDLVTRPDGKTVDLAYETSSGRLDTITIAEGVYDYAYYPLTPTPTTDPDGQLQSISAPDGAATETIAFAWDGTLPLATTWSGPVAGSVSRTFDDDFRVATETIGGTAAVSFGYDGDSLLTSAGAETITRDPTHGLITATSLGTVTTSETPSPFAELSADGASVGGSSIYANTYTQRDALGRITAKTETIQTVTTTYAYSYTPAGQLDVVTINGTPSRDYGYDANGNRTHVNGSLVGAYDAQDRLTSYQGTTYTYSEAGDLESKLEAGATTGYAYDALGNLRAVSFQNGMRIEYVIDGQNRRVGKKVCAAPCTGGATEQIQQGFLYADQLRVVAELDGSNNVVSRFVYGTKAHVPDYMIKSGVTYRLVTDHLGSVRMVVNTADANPLTAVVQRLDYDEWGNVTADSSPGFQPFGFAGGLYDRDTKLTRFGARDYDARVGRWTSKDPARFMGRTPNLYGYALSDPITFVDPNGLVVREVAVGAVCIVAGCGLGAPGGPLTTAAGCAVGAVTGEGINTLLDWWFFEDTVGTMSEGAQDLFRDRYQEIDELEMAPQPGDGPSQP